MENVTRTCPPTPRALGSTKHYKLTKSVNLPGRTPVTDTSEAFCWFGVVLCSPEAVVRQGEMFVRHFSYDTPALKSAHRTYNNYYYLMNITNSNFVTDHWCNYYYLLNIKNTNFFTDHWFIVCYWPPFNKNNYYLMNIRKTNFLTDHWCIVC